ncbi:MAG: hypothetical protein C5B59_02240 [Bacteroidetes bacterium]|nr:MAG: hypothetical protein C5B59_02240 [Bacteroidota bacterium]
MLPRLTLCCFLFFTSSVAFAQTEDIFRPDSVRKEITAKKIQSSLRIDGVLNEPEWQLAAPSPMFTEIEPKQGEAPQFQTTVRILYNKQNLYIGIFAKDSMGKKAIRATDFKRDFNVLAHDHLVVTFDGFNDNRNAMCFATNAYGVQRDYLSFDDLYFDFDWDGLWMVRTSRTDSGWYAEMAIPWQTLRYKRSRDSVQNWGFNVYRNRRQSNEGTALSLFPRVYTVSRMEYAGILKNLQPPPPKSNIRIQPYFLTSVDRSSYNSKDSSNSQNVTNAKVGGDIKWAINPNNILDLTVNTDFAQADADLQVNNVTQFSVFFPEKRQFFLENASLFSPVVQQAIDGSGGIMNLQPFFSRTIGLDSAGNPIPIIAGGRFVSRSAKRNFGGIVMRQAGTSTTPATNFFVGRYSDNFGEQNRIGGLVSVKNNSIGTNTEATLDGFFRISRAQSINSIFTFTNTSNLRQQGFAGIAQYYNSTNNYKIWYTQSIVTKNFDPEMGFVSRKDVIGTTPGMNYYYRGRLLPFKKILRALEPGVLPEFYWQASTGKFIERSLYFYPVWFNFQNGAYFGYGVVPVYKMLTDSFAPLNVAIAPGTYNYVYNDILFTTDPSKFISLAGDYKWGGYFNGKLISADWKLLFAPIPQISILGELNRNHFMNVGVSKKSTTVDLYILQCRLALNPRIQLTGFYQKNSLDNSQNYYIRFSWEYKPLSYIYFIYNHGTTNDVLNSTKQSDGHVIAKISYLKQL